MIKTMVTPDGCQNVEMTADEISALQSGQAASASEILAASLIQSAQSSLDKSDMVALRCLKAGIAFPTTWQTFVASCRAIVNGGAGPIPDQPAYPEGT